MFTKTEDLNKAHVKEQLSDDMRVFGEIETAEEGAEP
jgi:hypothetical protein